MLSPGLLVKLLNWFGKHLVICSLGTTLVYHLLLEFFNALINCLAGKASTPKNPCWIQIQQKAGNPAQEPLFTAQVKAFFANWGSIRTCVHGCLFTVTFGMLNCPVFLGVVCSDFHACLTRWSGSHWEIGIGGKFFPAVTKVLRCRGSKSISKSSKWKKKTNGYTGLPF